MPGKCVDSALTWLGVSKLKSASNQTMITYRCLYPGCDVVSKKLGNINNHFRTHDKIRPYQCHVCKSKDFTQLANLRRHYMSQHPHDQMNLKPRSDLRAKLRQALEITQ